MRIIDISGSRAEWHQSKYFDKIAMNPGDCGLDLYGEPDRSINHSSFGHGYVVSVPTGIHVAVPSEHYGMLIGRSSSVKNLMGARVVEGIIDHGYTGEIRVIISSPLAHDGYTDYRDQLICTIIDLIKSNIALAQMIFVPYLRFEPRTVSQVEGGMRGARGFGSTDRQVEAQIPQ